MRFPQVWPFHRKNSVSALPEKPNEIDSILEMNKDPTSEKGEFKEEQSPITSNLLLPDTRIQSLQSYYHVMIGQHFPKDFDEKFQRAMPFVGASFIIWPVFWLYRGLDWGYQRQYVTLPVYIQKTYLQARIIQVALLFTGIMIAASQSRGPTNGLHEITHKYDDITRNL